MGEGGVQWESSGRGRSETEGELLVSMDSPTFTTLGEGELQWCHAI